MDPHPRLHILAERYAHLTASMLLLHADFLDGPLDTNIDRLRYAGGDCVWLCCRAEFIFGFGGEWLGRKRGMRWH
jgi:hypothetical protein